MSEFPTSQELQSIRRELRWIKLYAGVLTAAVVGLALAVLRPTGTFEELNVRRINVVEASGATRLVIANAEKFPVVKLGGKEYPRKKGIEPAGIVFYDAKGMEMGGLALTDNTSGRLGALALDYPNFDAVGLSTVVSADGKEATAGLIINSHPPADLDVVAASKVVQRRVGIQNRNENAEVILSDPQGQERLRLVVDDQGEPSIELLDAEGKVTLRLSGETKSPDGAARTSNR